MIAPGAAGLQGDPTSEAGCDYPGVNVTVCECPLSVDDGSVRGWRFLSDVRSVCETITVCGCVAVPRISKATALPAVI